VIVLDENFPGDQREILTRWRIRFRHIGTALARQGIKDPEIIPLLHRLSRPTLITRDKQLYVRRLRHRTYALVVLDVNPVDAALFTRRFLRHPSFRTFAQRQGCVIRVGHEAVHVWRPGSEREEEVAWVDQPHGRQSR
jgi:hypothetical protein